MPDVMIRKFIIGSINLVLLMKDDVVSEMRSSSSLPYL